MGKLFRDSRSHKYSLFGKRRIKDGECAAIWDANGKYRTVEGPKFVRVFMSDVAFLDRFVATPSEYLIVKTKDGRRTHIPGPCAMFKDPVIHQSVQLKPAVQLNDSEVVVVYNEAKRDTLAEDSSSAVQQICASPSNRRKELKQRKDAPATAAPAAAAAATAAAPPQLAGAEEDPAPPARKVARRVVRGPTQFIPKSDEWLHEFKWHGRVPENKARYKSGLLEFTKLRTLPSTLYYNISECRTADDAELEVKLMLFYHMEDLASMLDSTHDPIGEILNGLCADVIRFCSERTFLQFVQDTARLNELANFKILQSRTSRMGFAVDKVVFRGYKASSQLQEMHDSAVRMNTKLRLDMAAQEQELALVEMKLSRSIERTEQEQKLNASKQRHELQLRSEAHAQQLEQRRLENDQEVAFLKSLREKGVDLTKYLCAKTQQGSVDSVKVIRIESGCDDASSAATRAGASSAGSDTRPHIHIGAAD